MADSDSVIRRRITTLYSQTCENEKEVGESSSRDDCSCDTKAGIAGQIKDVAEVMFHDMCHDLGQEVITKGDIDGALQSLFTKSVNPTQSLFQTSSYAQSAEVTKSAINKLLLEAIRSSPAQQVTCELFCDYAVRYSKGDVPLFQILRSADDKDLEEYKAKHANLGGLFSSPVHTLQLLYQDSLRWIERQGVKWLWSSFSTKQAYWLIAAYVLPLMTISFIVSSLSTALFTGAMIALMLITLQIGIKSEKLQIKKEYLSLFQHFNKRTFKIEMGPPRQDIVHYVNFIIALVVAVFSLEFSYLHPAFYSVLLIISAIAMVLVIFQYNLHEQQLFRHVLITKMPILFIAVLAKISDYVPFSQVLLDTLVLFQIPLSHDFSLKVSMITVMQVALHIYLMVACLREANWDTFYSTLGPLCLSMCWFTLFKYFLDKSSSLYVLSLIFICASLPFMLSLLIAVFFASPWVFLYHFGFTAPFFYSCGFVAGITIIFLMLALIWKYLPSFWMNLSLDYVFLLSVIVTIPLLLYLSAWNISLYQLPRLPPVSLEEYGKYCGPRNWNVNSVQTQINCVHLEGRVLTAQGMVEHVSISKMVDTMADSIRFLSASFQRSLTCVLGETQPMCGNLTDASTCSYNGCHFHSSLQYTFEIELRLQNTGGKSVLAKLIVSNQYRGTVITLEENSVLKFNATFVSGMGTDILTLQALGLKVDGIPDQHHLEEREMHQHLLHGFFRSLIKTMILVADVVLGLGGVIN